MYSERYELSTERINEIVKEKEVGEPWLSYFRRVSEFAGRIAGVYELKTEGKLCKLTREEAESLNNELFSDIVGSAYEKSYANPEFVGKIAKDNGCNIKVWQHLCFLYTQLRGLIPYAYEGNIELLTLYFELFIEVYGIFRTQENEAFLEHEVHEAIYWFERDNLDIFVRNELSEKLDPKRDFAADIIMNSDLDDTAYLYSFGEYISEDELKMSAFLSGLPEDSIKAMARTYTEGYRIGFVKAGKPLEKKLTVNIRYHLGFERMIREAVRQFDEMGLKPVIYRAPVFASTTNQNGREDTGYSGAVANRQYEYDHRDDRALFFDREYIRRRLDILKAVYEENKTLANGHAGPAVVETFGADPFTPKPSEYAIGFSESGRKLAVSYKDKAGRLANEYIIGKERSFTIISYPMPEIGKDFEEIFKETVKLNTLDYKRYEMIQQKLIDTLDKAQRVHVLGKNGNETDLTVELYKLSDPGKETIFENCVADVNIPVGEVFTTPRLKGTNGLLHVKEVYLNGLKYIDLRLTFKDGVIETYSCGNFEDPAENSRFIRENLLYHHDTLPLGEFAIGTNTTAYRMSRDHDIGGKLPILIGEKTGPHFAVGDTCYAREEEVRVYNPDGKEIVARSNDYSDRRESDPDKAYFYCHTDITIPYDELMDIYALGKDGESTALIEDGLFVLEGTGELNEPLLRS